MYDSGKLLITMARPSEPEGGPSSSAIALTHQETGKWMCKIGGYNQVIKVENGRFSLDGNSLVYQLRDTEPISFVWKPGDWREESRTRLGRTVQHLESYDGMIAVWKTDNPAYRRITWTREVTGSESPRSLARELVRRASQSVVNEQQTAESAGCCALQ